MKHMKTTKLEQAFLDFLKGPPTVGSMMKVSDAIKQSDRLQKRCLEALDQEALAADEWQRRAEKCPAWYEIRAELRDQLFPNAKVSDSRPDNQ